jgi:ribonuclease Z
MRAAFHPYLPNGLFGDPAVWIDAPDLGRSLLLDLGELHRLPPRKLLRVDRVVVSHAHMDHFIGFDHLLRLLLRRERELTLSGPAGFIERVRARAAGYTWNLLEGYPVCFTVEEIADGRVRSARFDAANRLRGESQKERKLDGALHAGKGYRLTVATFDHGIPVLGARLDESEPLSVDGDVLRRMGLVPGEWLAELKQLLRAGASPQSTVRAATASGGSRDVAVAQLDGIAVHRVPGQSIAYLTDLSATEPNLTRARELVLGVDLLICEAAFLHEDVGLATERGHLTARQAGHLAADAEAKRLAPFHFSPRYDDRAGDLLREAAAAFAGPVVELPEGPVP